MMHIVTVATHSERYLPVLEKQVEDKNLKLVKLGMGKKYSGHSMKDLEMIEYLKGINKEDIVVFLDGFDSLMLANQGEVLEKFKALDAKLVLSVENVGMLRFIHATIFETIQDFYLNTGLYMGYAGFLLNFLQDMYKDNNFTHPSNQKTWSTYLKGLEREKKFDGIVLDKNSDIFLNHSFTTANYPYLKKDRLYLDKKTKPCFIQGNGCEDMSHIINATGHKKYDIHKDTYWRDKIKYSLRAVFKIYNPILTFYIYLIIILIFILGFFVYRWYKNRKNTNFYIMSF
jgi:hypothetical protein